MTVEHQPVTGTRQESGHSSSHVGDRVVRWAPGSLDIMAWVQLLRVRSAAGAPVLAVVGAVLLGTVTGWTIVCSAVSAFALISFCNMFNDVLDRHLDALSKPWRPLPSGRISVHAACVATAVAAAVTLAAAAAVGAASVLVGFAGLLLGAAYSMRLKSTVLVGNLTVAVVCAAMLALPMNRGARLAFTYFVAIAMVFLFIVAHEIYKTVLDRDGDNDFGLKTVATAHAELVSWTALLVVHAMLVAAMCAAPLLGASIAFALVGSLTIAIPSLVSASFVAVTFNGRWDWTPVAYRIYVLSWYPGAATLLLLR